VAYKNEAFTLFEDLMNSVWTDFARLVFHVQVAQEGPNGAEGVAPTLRRGPDGGGAARPVPRAYQPAGSSTGGASRVSYSSGIAAGAGALAAAAAEAVAENDEAGYIEPDAPAFVEQRRVSTDEQLGRNDPCWCGSGKKFKRCHGA
jgi:preprotein translocase subunit SecA